MICKEELFTIKGGAGESTVINTIIKVVASAMEIGRTVGTIIKRKLSKAKC